VVAVLYGCIKGLGGVTRTSVVSAVVGDDIAVELVVVSTSEGLLEAKETAPGVSPLP